MEPRACYNCFKNEMCWVLHRMDPALNRREMEDLATLCAKYSRGTDARSGGPYTFEAK